MLYNLVVDALIEYGFDFISAMEYYHGFIKEVKLLPKGKYTYIVGNHEISFRKDV